MISTSLKIRSAVLVVLLVFATSYAVAVPTAALPSAPGSSNVASVHPITPFPPLPPGSSNVASAHPITPFPPLPPGSSNVASVHPITPFPPLPPGSSSTLTLV
jgi:hypothetical protein